ncbi:MAG: hypothetical protein HQM09_09035 [Candidatus Riflebacteria bacterium]|nr:hypothetical protein [Candidatus Riflebacteria bacterium]
MRRLLCLLFALLIFITSSGCSDGVGVASVTTSYVAMGASFLMPASRIAMANVKGSTYWKDFTLRINGTDYPPSSVATDSTSATATINFAQTFAKTTLGAAWSETAKTINNVELVEGGQTVVSIAMLSANDQAPHASTMPLANTVVFQLVRDATTGGLILTTLSGTASATSPITSGAQSLYLEAINYIASGGALATLSADVTDVSYPTASFTLHFSNVVASATSGWLFSMTDVTSGNLFTLSDANGELAIANPILASGPFGSCSIVTISLIGSGTAHQLLPSHKYTMSIVNTSLCRADSISTKLTNAILRTFTTRP